MATATQAQTDFYREFLMARESFHPRDFGVDMDKAEFIDAMVDDFNTYFHGSISVDELLLHPSDAIAFVADVRRKHGWFSLPEDIILRSILQRRKKPAG